MRIQDLHVLPKFSDGWSYLYVEHCRVDQEDKAIAFHDQAGKTPVPCANLALLMLGPGVSITHAAISVLADHGCLVAWCGEEGVRFYATGMGETRNAAIVSAGFSPALGFIHTGKMLSFVYDVADLYKTEITVPVAFRAAAENAGQLERRVRITCRDRFVSTRLLERIIPDIQTALMLSKAPVGDTAFDLDAAAPGFLWDNVEGAVEGGRMLAPEIDETEPDDGGPDS
jgi:CRISPR/Cas system-associated endonuclease Cas1